MQRYGSPTQLALGEESRPVLTGGKRTGISVKVPQPCGCIFEWYTGGRGYYRRGCSIHPAGAAVYICPANSCGKILPTLKDLMVHKKEHAY